jgi:hypothetical protein
MKQITVLTMAAMVLIASAGASAAPMIDVDFSGNSAGNLEGASAADSGTGLTGTWSKYQSSSYNYIEIEGSAKELKVYRTHSGDYECQAEADVDSSLPEPITADGEGFYVGLNIRFEGSGSADGGLQLFGGSDTLVAGALGGNFVAGGAGPVDSGQAVTLGTDYRLIAKFTDNAQNDYDDRIQLWIDATSESDSAAIDEYVTSEVVGWQNQKITKIGLGGLGALNSGKPTVYVDDVLVGTSFADVVPEPATMSLLAIGGLGALLRRKRR